MHQVTRTIFTKDEIYGSWTSESLELYESPAGKVWCWRELEVMDGEWSLEVTFLEAEAPEDKAYRIRGMGTINIGAPATEDAAARYADFNFDKRYLTPLSEKFARLFASGDCGGGWPVGEERDISRTGCMFVPSVWRCPTEYDIMKFEGGKLFLGDRHEDLCDFQQRSTHLSPYPLTRA